MKEQMKYQKKIQKLLDNQGKHLIWANKFIEKARIEIDKENEEMRELMERLLP